MEGKISESSEHHKKCFVLSPIGDPNTEARRMADQVFKFIIKPAVGDWYEPIRGDQISEPGMITTQVIQHVLDSELVIANLTGGNPNVYYELALRHMTLKPCIQMIKKGEKIPFNVSGLRTILYDLDPEAVQDAKRELQTQIRSVKGGVKMDTPISVSQVLRYFEQRENPEMYINIEKIFMNNAPRLAEELMKRFFQSRGEKQE